MFCNAAWSIGLSADESAGELGREHAAIRRATPTSKLAPAAFASSITACASRPTASHSPSGTTIAALGNEIRYFAIELFLRNGRQSCAKFFAELELDGILSSISSLLEGRLA